MGLLKETMQAIIRIDRNLSEIRKELAWERDAKHFRATYLQNPIEPNGSTFYRVMTEKDFCYPANLTFGGRLRAVRLFNGLTQAELADVIGVTPPHISNLEADKSIPSAMFIRSVSLRLDINETWLATGHLPQTSDRPAVLTLDDLKKANVGKPLQTLHQMEEQMGNLMGFYSQTPQLKETEASDQPNQTQGQ